MPIGMSAPATSLLRRVEIASKRYRQRTHGRAADHARPAIDADPGVRRNEGAVRIARGDQFAV